VKRMSRSKPARISLKKKDAVMSGIPLLEKRVRRHLKAGRTADAVREYEDDIEACHAAVLAALDNGAVILPEVGSAIDYRVAHALLNLGVIEAARVRIKAALERTDEAVSICRQLNHPSIENLSLLWLGDAVLLGQLGQALWSFAAVRVLGRTQISEAAAAIKEAALIADPLAALDPGKYQALANQVAYTQRQVQLLAGRIEDGNPLGMPGTELLEVVDWRELLWLGMLEKQEVTGLLKELKNPDQVEAFLRVMDERGDAEGARKLGELLQARDDLAGADAAFRRGDERGSADAAFYLGMNAYERGDLAESEAASRRAIEGGNHNADYYLGLILNDKGDIDGARAAFQRLSEADDPEMASTARDMLSQLGDGS
jgi:tetratricopeptide (TPR) repeat protein